MRDLLPYLAGIFLLPLLFVTPVLAGWVDLNSPVGQVGLFFGAISPSLVAVGLTQRNSGWQAVRNNLLKFPRSSPGRSILLYGTALGLPAILGWLSLGLYASMIQPASVRWLTLPAIISLAKSVIVSPLGEELGWRGYLQPRLQQKMGPLAAGLVTGSLWTLWHYWYFLLPEYSSVAFGWFAIDTLGESLWYTWFYHLSGANIALAILFHMAGNFWLKLIPLTQQVSNGLTPYSIFAILFLITGFMAIQFGLKVKNVPTTIN
jgi:membrane protease YdiL (CAAX protease family)